MDKKIAVIGAGITGLVTAHYLKKKGLDFTIFERTNHIGGVIRTDEENGFLFERGPNSGVISNIEVVNLFEELKKDCELEIADQTSKKRLIWKGNKWHAIPGGMISAIKTPLFTFNDKIRVLAEPFRKKGTNQNESLASLVKRRLGKSFLTYAIDPFISGIYAGDPEYLVTKYALPKLYNLEQTYGSFIKGAIKKKKETKTEDEKKISKQIFSFKGGLKELINALVKNIGKENIKTKCTDVKFDYRDGRFFLKNEIFTDVISTVNAPNIKTILPFISDNDLENILNLKYAKVVGASIGFKNWTGGNLKAFGGLVPMKEKKNILGVLYLSTLFSGRAPELGALLTVFVGGTRREDLALLKETELKEVIAKDIQEMLGLETFNPDLFKLSYYEQAIAQYGESSGKRIEAIHNIEKKFPGLLVGGSVVGGVGIADRIKQSFEISKRVIQ
ncbi:MAG: protoporphyrinogen oxidase [Bacteroidales bacterium]|nr:protoporphyrinogen oxidase [Bacteroidales bacterium]